MKKYYILILFIGLTMCTTAQDQIKSYFCQEISGPSTMYGPNVRVPDRQATYVEWFDDGIIKMMDGTVWKYRGTINGLHRYGFVKATGVIMPGTRYTETVFSADYSRMQINYFFGIDMPGIVMPMSMNSIIPMNSLYVFLGEGTQPAYDWMSGQF